MDFVVSVFPTGLEGCLLLRVCVEPETGEKNILTIIRNPAGEGAGTARYIVADNDTLAGCVGERERYGT